MKDGCKLQIRFILLIVIYSLTISLIAQDLPPCGERPTIVDFPRVGTAIGCMEEALSIQDGGEFAFTRLTFGEDSTLYATRPYTGEIWKITDTNGDFLPDSPTVFASGLTLPNGITYHNGFLYVSGKNHIYKIDEQGTIEILVDDLAWSVNGAWTGDLIIHDDRIYVGTGAPCDFCEWQNSELGAILSFTLDGNDKQLVATGLRFPVDIAFFQDSLWVVDTARNNLRDVANLDELNQVEAGAHFGFPYCIGQDNRPDPEFESISCAEFTPPIVTFPTHSIPLAIVPYTANALPIEDSLLIVMQGSHNGGFLNGYYVALVTFDMDNTPQIRRLIPFNPIFQQEGVRDEELYYRGGGIYPHSPLDVAVSPEGWIYLSVGGGRIFAFRTR